MASFRVRAFDVNRNPLNDRVDVLVRDLSSMNVVGQSLDTNGSSPVTVKNLVGGRVYSVQVRPMRHRPVGVVQRATDASAPADVDVFCPVHPERVIDVGFPLYPKLPDALKIVLRRSSLEVDRQERPKRGKRLYDGLDAVPKAGLLNLFAKMDRTTSGGRTMWSFVSDVYRVRGDRIFANVSVDFRDFIKSAASGGDFAATADTLHTPPPGFVSAGSFKHQLFQAGVLQLTFFASDSDAQPGAAPAFRIDADIDDAGGIGHVFQVLRNSIGDRETNPYDIHQILTFHQLLRPGYELRTV